MNYNEAKYYYWLCSFVPNSALYSQLLFTLYVKEFTYIFVMDGNRAENGLELREQFGIDLGDKPCSILEMIVALAMKIEDQMGDDYFGNRTSFWIENMLDSLGLSFYTDNHYNDEEVADILNQFLRRQYSENGSGGLFTVNRPDLNMRTMDIWMQANWFLSTYY